jgi:hypothetical protein
MDPKNFDCPISSYPAYDAVVCPQGHLFDQPFIQHWLLTNNSCPVDRLPLRSDQLISVFTIRAFLGPRPDDAPLPPPVVVPPPLMIPRPVLRNRRLARTPVVPQQIIFDTVLDPTAPVFNGDFTAFDQNIPQNFNFNALHDDVPPPTPVDVLTPVFDSDVMLRVFPGGRFENIPGRRIHHLNYDNLFNPRSGASNALNLYARNANSNFIFLNGLSDRFVEFRRYTYRTSISERERLIRSLTTTQNLYLYDIFAVRPGLYVITTFRVRADGSRHNLTEFNP